MKKPSTLPCTYEELWMTYNEETDTYNPVIVTLMDYEYEEDKKYGK
jgi:hypothetical protein